MKKLLLVLLLFSAGVNAQILDLSKIATKEDIENLTNKVDKTNKRIDSLNAAGSGVVTPPVVPDCSPRPTFKILSSSATGVTIQFDANGLYDLSLTLYGDAGSIKSISYHRLEHRREHPNKLRIQP